MKKALATLAVVVGLLFLAHYQLTTVHAMQKSSAGGCPIGATCYKDPLVITQTITGTIILRQCTDETLTDCVELYSGDSLTEEVNAQTDALYHRLGQIPTSPARP